MAKQTSTYVIVPPLAGDKELIRVVNDINRVFTAMSNFNSSSFGYEARDEKTLPDFDLASLTTDNQHHELSLSSILPDGAEAVILRVRLRDDAVGSVFQLSPTFHSVSTQQIFRLYTAVANEAIEGFFIVPVDEKKTVRYLASNVTFTTIYLYILGWFR